MREGKDMGIALMLDFYEELLTEKQSDVMRKYYDEDYSLAELANELGISKQAVQFSLKQAERKLEGFEEKLKLIKRFNISQKLIEAYEKGNDMGPLVELLRESWED